MEDKCELIAVVEFQEIMNKRWGKGEEERRVGRRKWMKGRWSGEREDEQKVV